MVVGLRANIATVKTAQLYLRDSSIVGHSTGTRIPQVWLSKGCTNKYEIKERKKRYWT